MARRAGGMSDMDGTDGPGRAQEPGRPAGAADAPLRPDALAGAVDWYVQLTSGAATASDRLAWQAWRQADPEHERAWRRTESITGRLGGIPAALGLAALDRPRAPGRRRTLAVLAMGGGAAALGWSGYARTPWRAWTADYRTGIGEHRELHLADGSTVVLNTDSAVDIAFDAAARQVLLRAGEILVQTAHDPTGTARPFSVATRAGRITALGTRFVVRQLDASVRVQVLEGAVSIQPADGGPAALLPAGRSAHFTAQEVEPAAAGAPGADAWTRGMLVADDMPLPDFLDELARYRRGRIGCDDPAARLRVSGAFPLDDTGRALALLENTLPVRVESTTRYWISVRAR